MRGGLSSIQQTLTPEAANVLTLSIAEAGRRNHGQTTPLHVAATLLASPTAFLRQACIRSHPNSSHPLQCRALELCFSVALERLPTTQGGSSHIEPSISNALMAALKRAQAHQRRGCPEQQQQPLLAVKVELEQLIVSILDDPSVSRVMREASFSSPAVKAAIEQGLNYTRSDHGPGPKTGLGFRPSSLGAASVGRNLYLNPRLQQGNGELSRGEDVRRVMDILSRSGKKNPVLVGETEPQEVVKEVLRRIEKDEKHDGVLKCVEVVSMEKEVGLDRAQMPAMVKELGTLIERKMLVGGGNGVILDLGDLKWLVDQPASQGVSEAAREVVIEMAKILRRFGEGSKFWFIGTASCETYLRCQVYHPTMENEWDLQVVSIVARPPLPGMLPRLGSNGGILSSSVECLSPLKSFPMAAPPLMRRVSENLDPSRKFNCCSQCMEKYSLELAKLVAEHTEKSSSEVKSDETRHSLPLWLQNAKLHANDTVKSKDQDLILRQKTQELQRKWIEICFQLHPNIHHTVISERITTPPLSLTGLFNPNLLCGKPFQPKLQQHITLGDALKLNISSGAVQEIKSDRATTPPGSPVRTDLVLGRTKPSVRQTALDDRPVTLADADSFKKLLKGLIDKVWWQTDAASAVASTITRCKSGNGRRLVGGSKGDTWLLFTGPDRTGKKKMAAALSELVCGVGPTLIYLGSSHDGDESDLSFRGKTAIDRIGEAVRRNPFSVIMLQDIDEADMLVRGSIKRAMERGRLVDSHGREISLGNVIFIVTSNWVPDQLKGLSSGGLTIDEEKLTTLASGAWQLRITVGKKATGKRPPDWGHDDLDRVTKQRKGVCPGLSFDLNQTVDTEDNRHDGSHNSSDLTVDHDEERVHENRGSPSTSSHDLVNHVDEAIIFKPVNFSLIKQTIERTILAKFSSILGDKLSMKIESKALEKILSGIWLGRTTIGSWVEKVLAPSIHQLKTTLPSSLAHPHEGKMVGWLELDEESESRCYGDWLPGRISVVAEAM